MEKKKWLQTGLAVTMVASVVLTGCTSTPTTSEGDTPKTDDAPKMDAVQELTLNLGEEIPTLDITLAHDAVSFDVLWNTMDGLVRIDKDNKVQPAVAEKWDISPDGTKYTFHIRDGVKWTNGDPVTAHDFEYSWKRTLDPKNKSLYGFMVAWVKGGVEFNEGKVPNADAVGIKALDDKTFEVTLDAPRQYFLETMAFPVFFPQNKKFIEAQGEKNGSEADKYISNGPFKLTAWNHEQNAVLEKNENYWNKDVVKLSKVNLLMVKASSAALNLYESGELDRTGLAREQVELYKDSKDVTSDLTGSNWYMQFNTANKVLNNAKIRQALTYGVDAEQYVKVVLNNGSVPATGLTPISMAKEYTGKLGDVLKRKDNGPKAKELLAEGLKELGIDKLPTLRYLTGESETSKKDAEFVKGQLSQNLGVNVEIEAVPFKLRLQKMNQGDFDIVSAGWNPDYNDPMTFLEMWTTDSPNNNGKWTNAEYDDLIKKSQVEPDPKKRMDMMVQAETLLMKELPIGPLYFSGRTSLTKPYVKDLIIPTLGATWDFTHAYVQGKK